jgi:tetratricopeptide (TPR) repeat protein
VYLDDGDHDAALPLLLEAASSATDWLVRYRAATGLERITNAAGRTETGQKAASAAIEALNAVIQARPDLPHALALKALVLGPGDDGLATLKRARELAPGHEHYAIWQAQFHLDRGEFADARRLLAPLLSPLFPGDIREYARSIMGQVVTVEQAAAERARTGDPAPRSAARPTQPTQTGEVQWVFRVLQPGELRIEGLLERIECPRAGVTIHVRQPDRALRFVATAFDAIEFLTYRDDLSGSIQCGPRKPADPVYITYVTDSKGSDGRVVAVEFLPKR